MSPAPVARLSAAHALPREALRLLEALAAEGASAAADPFDADRLVVAGRRNGVSVRIAGASRRAAEALVAEGLAVWRGAGTRRRLDLAEPGRARLARSRAPEGADPFLAQQLPLARRPVVPGEPAALIDEAESPLAWLARRRDRDGRPFIDAAALGAGERLRRDLERAQMLPRVTSNWSASGAGGRRGAGPADLLDAALAARGRVEAAMAAVGADLSGLLFDVCGFLKGLETVESERGWPPRSAKIVLRIALGRLAEHYGLSAHAEGPARAPLRAWQAPQPVAPG